jgi:catechol-2,3-dioxygenase
MSDAAVCRIGHVGLQVLDLDRAVAFAIDVLGLRETERDAGTVFLSCNERHHELMLNAGDTVALHHLAFEVADATTLDVLRARLDEAGWRLLDEPVEAGVADAVRCVGPAGVVFELFHDMATIARDSPDDATGVRPHRLEHATLTVSDLDAMERFFVEMLGFVRSDRVPGAISWLRCSSRHHDVNLMAGSDAFHHMAWEVDGLADVGRLADLLARRDGSLLWGPGRHAPGNVLFGYFADDSGVINELCAEVDIVAPGYAPKSWPHAPSTANRWGPQAPPDFLARGIPIRRVP